MKEKGESEEGMRSGIEWRGYRTKASKRGEEGKGRIKKGGGRKERSGEETENKNGNKGEGKKEEEKEVEWSGEETEKNNCE